MFPFRTTWNINYASRVIWNQNCEWTKLTEPNKRIDNWSKPIDSVTLVNSQSRAPLSKSILRGNPPFGFRNGDRSARHQWRSECERNYLATALISHAYCGRDIEQKDDLTRENLSWGATPQWSGYEAAPSCEACPESATKGAASPASMKLSRNLQAGLCSNARYLGLYKSQTRLVHKEGNANGKCCTQRKSRFRASQTRLRLGGRSHIGGDRLHS